MKHSKPISMIAYASMMKDAEVFQLNKEKEELSLSYEQVYFYNQTLQVSIDNIESFTLSNCCSLFYFLTKDSYLHLYEINRKRIEKNIFKIEGSESIIDIVKWENVLFVLTDVNIIAYSMITWQRLWEKYFSDIGDVKSLAIDKKRHLYLLTTEKKIFKSNYSTGSKFTELVLKHSPKKPLSLSIKEPYLYVIEASQITAYHTQTLEKSDDLTVDLSQFVETYNLKIENIEKIIYKNNNLWVLDKGGELSFINQKSVYEKQKTFSYIFNSTQLGCHWHTMQLSFSLPEKGGLIEFKVRAYDNENNKGDFESFENRSNIYFETVVGQYLEVVVTLFSDPQHTSSPLFHSMRAFFPKKTYLEYLPAVYQEDKQSKLLLERYLSVFQTISRTIEEKIETSHLFLDPQTTPVEFLEWLSLWVGLHKKQYWSDNKWRILLARSSYFFKKRGTREGLMEIMKLYTDEEPMIMEAFQWQCREKEQNPKIGIYSFCVLFTPKQIPDRKDLRIIQEIIDFWKPAHTKGKVSILSDKMILGKLIFLGKNSYLGKEEPFILGEAILSVSTRIADREDSTQIESHSRVGMDTQIKY